MFTKNSRDGFTLIEMSLVLVIIGLIVGGILVGRDLVEASRMRSQVTQLQQIQQALQTFRGKYEALPGDFCANANKFGIGCGNATGPRDDNMIQGADTSSPIHSIGYEPEYFFGQMVQAKLLPASYMTGKDAAGSACWYDASMKQGYYSMNLNPQFGMLAETYKDGIWVWLGLSDCAASIVSTASPTGVMSPAQALALDTKMDDGIPGTGVVLAFTYTSFSQVLDRVDNTAGQCVTTAASTAYNIADGTLQCRMLIKMQ